MAAFKKYKFAIIATDVVIFTIQNDKLKVLLIKMKKAPFTGRWATPGGLVNPNESVDESAVRHLFEKTGLKNVYLEQLYTFGRVKRDPFGRVVSVAYFVLIPRDAKTKVFTPLDPESSGPQAGNERRIFQKLNKSPVFQGGDLTGFTTKQYQDIAWFPAGRLPAMAYDHKEIIACAVERLRSKLAYSNIIYGLMPKEFTLGELQAVYELILGQKLDKRNFRRKVLSLKLLKELSKKLAGEANRPAVLYTFTSHKSRNVEMI